MMDPRLSTSTMKVNISGITSQAIFQSGSSRAGTWETCAYVGTMWTA